MSCTKKMGIAVSQPTFGGAEHHAPGSLEAPLLTALRRHWTSPQLESALSP